MGGAGPPGRTSPAASTPPAWPGPRVPASGWWANAAALTANQASSSPSRKLRRVGPSGKAGGAPRPRSADGTSVERPDPGQTEVPGQPARPRGGRHAPASGLDGRRLTEGRGSPPPIPGDATPGPPAIPRLRRPAPCRMRCTRPPRPRKQRRRAGSTMRKRSNRLDTVRGGGPPEEFADRGRIRRPAGTNRGPRQPPTSAVAGSLTKR